MESDNLLLAGLPSPVLARLRPRMESVALAKRQILFEAGEPVSYLYCPTSGLVSLLGTTAEGDSVELAGVSSNGVVGLPLAARNDLALHVAKVCVAGTAIRIPRRALDAELRSETAVQHTLLNWSRSLLVEFSQAVVCHRFHHTLERLCSWLLAATERVGAERLDLTQEDLAGVLGARRTAVGAASLALQDAGAIRYRHGRILIVSRRRLELSACECHEATREFLASPSCS